MSATELRSAGDVASAKGEFKEAIRLFSKLIDVEPSPFHYFKRASVNLRQRKYADVIMDLNKALSMDPTFVKGLANRAKIHKMRGDCEAAKDDYNAILKLEPDNKSAGQELPSLDQCIANIRAADHFFETKDFHSARHYYSQAIEAAPESVKLLLKRAQCDEALGDFQNILVDTRRLLQNDENDLEALYVRGNAYYMMGEVEPALSHFRRGLKLDPEHKKLKARYKQIRAFTSQIFNGDEDFGQNKFADAIESYNAALELENNHPVLSTQLHLKLCKAYVKAKKGSLAAKACTHFLEKDEGNAEGFNYRGQAYMLTEEYQQAVNDFQKATELSQQDGDLRQKLQQAQLELKKSQRKNYYKILGVEKDASGSDIKKAFRALALKWHPDKNPKEEQEACEKMFRDIGEAYEVLSNDESRRKYDAGEDIQFEQGGGGHPGFQHFHGFPFGGGGQQHFTFTFG